MPRLSCLPPAILPLALAVTLAASAPAQAPQNLGDYEDSRGLPDTPAGKLAQEMLDVLNSGDRERARQFVSLKFTPAFRDAFAMEEHLAAFLGVFHQSQGLELFGVRHYEKQQRGDEMVVIVRNKLTQAWEAVVLTVEPTAPHLISRLMFSPARPPKAYEESAPLTETELVREMRTYVERLAARDAFSGAVLLAKDGRVLFKAAYGLASKRFNVPNKIDTKFNLGSMNKMFTATAIALLVERGKLSFDDPIGKYLDESWLKREALDKITIHHLLTHTSGLGNYFNDEFWNASRMLYRDLDDYKPLIRDDQPAFEPGTSWSYSNTGMFLAGVVIEKVAGKSYFDFVRENIFKPAGMINTDSYEMDKPTPNLAVGYSRTDDGWENNLYKHVIKGGPAGGGFSTVEDLLRFDQAMRAGKIVGRKMLDELWTTKPESNSPEYGYGFGVFGVTGDRIVGHSGGFPGISSELSMYLDRGYTIAVMSNYDNGAQIVAEKCADLLNRVVPPKTEHGQTREQPTYRSGVKLRSAGEVLQVTGVIPDSAANDAGLEAGDVILKVNGKSPKRVGPNKIRELFGSPAPVALEIRRGDNTFRVKMTPKPAKK